MRVASRVLCELGLSPGPSELMPDYFHGTRIKIVQKIFQER